MDIEFGLGSQTGETKFLRLDRGKIVTNEGDREYMKPGKVSPSDKVSLEYQWGVVKFYHGKEDLGVAFNVDDASMVRVYVVLKTKGDMVKVELGTCRPFL